MNKEDKVMTYATAFCMVSAGVLMLAFVPSAIGIRQTQKAQAFNLMRDIEIWYQANWYLDNIR